MPKVLWSELLFWGDSYHYVKLHQGFSVSPAEWQQTINESLSKLPNHKEFCLAIMDDLSIFSKTKEEHFKHISMVIEILKKFGLKISPKKCQFFLQEADYLGFNICLHDGYPCIKAQRSKIEAIQHLPTPTTKRQTRGLIRLYNYLSLFAPELQNYL